VELSPIFRSIECARSTKTVMSSGSVLVTLNRDFTTGFNADFISMGSAGVLRCVHEQTFNGPATSGTGV